MLEIGPGPGPGIGIGIGIGIGLDENKGVEWGSDKGVGENVGRKVGWWC